MNLPPSILSKLTQDRAEAAITHLVGTGLAPTYAMYILNQRLYGRGEFNSVVDSHFADLFPEVAYAHSFAREQAGFFDEKDMHPIDFANTDTYFVDFVLQDLHTTMSTQESLIGQQIIDLSVQPLTKEQIEYIEQQGVSVEAVIAVFARLPKDAEKITLNAAIGDVAMEPNQVGPEPDVIDPTNPVNEGKTDEVKDPNPGAGAAE